MGDPRQVSRRGLFGALGRGFRGLKESAEDAAKTAAGQSRPEASPLPEFDCIRRDDDETLHAEADESGAWVARTGSQPLPPEESVVLDGDDLFERVVVVRVHETHYAATSAECPADGSDLYWAAALDRLRCPGCGSLWRLDGEPRSGPGDSTLAHYFVDVEEDGRLLRVREA